MDEQTPLSPQWLHRRLSAHSFWLMQTLSLISGTQPGTLAQWIRQRSELLKRTAPPEDGSIAPEAYDRGILQLWPHIADVGDTLAQDLEGYQAALESGEAQPPPSFSASGGAIADGFAAMCLAPVVERLATEQLATRYWLSESYHLMSGGRPGAMAARIQGNMRSLKNAPPNGPAGMSAEDLEKAMLNDLPPILHMGEQMAEHLLSAQAAQDARGG
jgi:hypothetical protein